MFVYRFTLIGVNTGFCEAGFPEVFTSLFSESIWTWIKQTASSEKYDVGLSNCGQELATPPPPSPQPLTTQVTSVQLGPSDCLIYVLDKPGSSITIFSI